MSIPRFLLAAVVSALVMLTLGWLWHASFMADFYPQHTALQREMPLTRIIVLGYLLLAILMTYFYPKGCSGGEPLAEGLRFGVFIGVLYTLPHALVIYGAEGGHTGTLVIVDA